VGLRERICTSDNALRDSPASVGILFRRDHLAGRFQRCPSARAMIAKAGHLGLISWPVSRGTGQNQLELHGTKPRTEWQIFAVLSMVLVCPRENKWCQKRDRDVSINRYIAMFYRDFSNFDTVENTVMAPALVLNKDSNRCGTRMDGPIWLSHKNFRQSPDWPNRLMEISLPSTVRLNAVSALSTLTTP